MKREYIRTCFFIHSYSKKKLFRKRGELGLGFQCTSKLTPQFVMKEDFKMIATGGQHAFLLKKNGELLAFGNNIYHQTGLHSQVFEGVLTPTLLLKDENLSIILSGVARKKWLPHKHSFFPKNFQTCVLYLLLVLGRKQTETGIKIPKFIRYEIIKRAH